MATIIWYEVYKAIPNMFDGDMEITRFQSTTDEKEAFDLVNDDRNTIKRFTRDGEKLSIHIWTKEKPYWS